MADKALLLVDDEPSLLFALGRELRNWAGSRGLRILTAGSEEAAEQVMATEQGAVCLVLSDVRMPGKSGIDLVHFVHEKYPDTIILLLTGYAELPEIIRAVQEGAFAYLLKPSEPDYLKAELEKALGVYLLKEKEKTHARRLQEDLQWAAELQQSLFSGPLPEVPGVRLSSVYRPQSELTCSGDYLDVFVHKGSSALLVGDVAGHGVRAALVASFLKALVGAAFVDPPIDGGGIRLDTVLVRLNDRICGSLPERLGMMVTLAACAIDPARGELVVASAGHPPLLLRRAGRVQSLAVEGLPLGASAGAVYTQRRLRLASDDLLVLYTDGIFERKGETIGEGERRLATAVEAETADAGLAARLADALSPADGYADDVAVLTAAITLPGAGV